MHIHTINQCNDVRSYMSPNIIRMDASMNQISELERGNRLQVLCVKPFTKKFRKNLQECTCLGVLFLIMLQAADLQLFKKRLQ